MLLAMVFFAKTAFCQETTDTPITHFVPQPGPNKIIKPENIASLTGRVIGVNLENVAGVAITNSRTAEKTTTDSQGIFKAKVAKDDTLTFEVGKYSRTQVIVRSLKDKLNIVMIKKKTDGLKPDEEGYNKARKDDEELLRILEKDAKLEGKWNY
jgi:hypothetical protein